MNRKIIFIGLSALGVLTVVIILVVTGIQSQAGSAQPGPVSSYAPPAPGSAGQGSGYTGATSTPVPTPSPTSTESAAPEDIYPDGYVPDHVDPATPHDHGDEGEDGHEHDDNGTFEDDDEVLPPDAFGNWTPTAEGFAQAFGDTTVGRDAWIAAMTPYASTTLIDELSKLGDPPPAKLNYQGVVLMKDTGGGRVDVAINYGAQRVTVTLLERGSGWVVETITGYER